MLQEYLTKHQSATEWERSVPPIDPATRYAASVDSIVRSVRLEIQGDLEDVSRADPGYPNERSVTQALDIARQLALQYARQTWVDIAGFVESDGRVGVLAHSHETGRRITFFVQGEYTRAIRTGVTEKPQWLEVQDPIAIRDTSAWIAGADQ